MQKEYSHRYKRFLRNFLLSSFFCYPGILEAKIHAQEVTECRQSPRLASNSAASWKTPEAPEATRPQQSQPNRESRPTYVAARREQVEHADSRRPSRNLPDLAESQAELEVQASEAVEPEQLDYSNEYHINFAMVALRSKPFTPASLSQKLEEYHFTSSHKLSQQLGPCWHR